MATIKISKEAALKVIEYSKDAYEELNGNTKVLNDQIMAYFQNLKDTVALQKYNEFIMTVENMMKQVGTTVENITEYCNSIIRWIDTMETY